MTNTQNTRQQNTQSTQTWFVYFVAIQYGGNDRIGFTNLELPLSTKVTTFADVQFIEQNLRSRGYVNALVMGYNLLRTETVPTEGRTR